MNDLTKYETSYISIAGNKINLSIPLARTALNIDPKVKDSEIYTFLVLCQHQKLDPFLGEVHFIYVNGRVQKVVGIDTFTNRLNDHPLCAGWSAGLILEENEKILYQDGTFYLSTQKIVGAWFKVHRKGWNDEFYWPITYKEYYREYYDKETTKYKPMGQWGSMPGTMIVKCAICAGCRKAFPQSFTGLYSNEEFGHNSEEVDNETIIEPEFEEIINKKQIETIYDAAKSKNSEIKIDSEKLVSYVIKEMIKADFLPSNTKINKDESNIAISKFNLILEWIKKSVALKEHKYNNPKSDDVQLIKPEESKPEERNVQNEKK